MKKITSKIVAHLGSGEMFKEPERSTGVSPRRFGSPHNAITPKKGTTSSSSLSTGVEQGDRYGPLLYRTNALYFIS